MRILFNLRPDAAQAPGGDVIQINQTRENLRKLGCETAVWNGEEESLGRFDVIHFFNLFRVNDYYKTLSRLWGQVPTVLSPVYRNRNEYLLNNPNWKMRAIQRIGGPWPIRALRVKSSRWRRQRQALERSSAVIVSSAEERKQLENDFEISLQRVAVITPGIDPSTFFPAPVQIEGHPAERIGDFVLCVGRIEDLKNQNNLIAALQGSGLKLVFVGDINWKFKEYCQRFLSQVDGKKIFYFSHMPQSELADFYRRASVVVAPSWLESFGMSILEGAACATPGVATCHSPIRELFGDDFDYCDPADITSIRVAVEKAIGRGGSKLSQKIRDEYSWQSVTGELYNVYSNILR